MMLGLEGWFGSPWARTTVCGRGLSRKCGPKDGKVGKCIGSAVGIVLENTKSAMKLGLLVKIKVMSKINY